MTCWQLIDLCLLLRMMWLWNMLSWEMRWELRCWVIDNERMIWAIEIVELRIVELDWIVKLCELHVFDGNELVVLNGWLICGKPRKKKDEIESICYMIKWEIGQCEIAPNDWYWKRCPEREKIELKKMPRKGKWLIWKKMPKWEKNVMRKMKNGLPNINLPI